MSNHNKIILKYFYSNYQITNNTQLNEILQNLFISKMDETKLY